MPGMHVNRSNPAETYLPDAVCCWGSSKDKQFGGAASGPPAMQMAVDSEKIGCPRSLKVASEYRALK